MTCVDRFDCRLNQLKDKRLQDLLLFRRHSFQVKKNPICFLRFVNNFQNNLRMSKRLKTTKAIALDTKQFFCLLF
jgi:hypothetical protein